jgi:CheY-like chemotaxis protein
MKPTLPLYQHPTLVIMVDDSASFVASMEFRMNPNLPVKSFSGSVEALRWIFASFRRRQEEPASLHRIEPAAQAPVGRAGLSSLRQLYQTVLDPRRFDAPAVVVVDYAMPHIDGLDFCRALDGLPCKKILFTGEADEMVAVDAFNRGLIDRYLKKGDPEALERLSVEIAALERQYFAERSLALHDLLAPHTYGFLVDETFVRLVQALIKRHGYVEHFLFPDPSGILFFDADGMPTLMVVESKVGLASHLEAAQEYGGPEELCSALRENRIVPFFWPSGGMYTEKIGDWKRHCMPANLCEGREDYFWALFQLPEGYLAGPVYPYNEFLKSYGRMGESEVTV